MLFLSSYQQRPTDINADGVFPPPIFACNAELNVELHDKVSMFITNQIVYEYLCMSSTSFISVEEC
jgi:hypothetical protein